MRKVLIMLSVAVFAAGCGDTGDDSTESAAPSAPPENVLELGIDGLSFVGPDEIKSGWTTVRINNDSGMTHFGLVYRLPEGVTADMVADEIINPFQESLTANLNGNPELAAEILGSIPAWVGDLVFLGGPGMISDGVVGEATMYLEPGNYIVECYVKTNGFQHNYNPEPGMHGMVVPLTVLDEPGGMAEPEGTVTMEISNSGYEITDGTLVPGRNVVRAEFVEQSLYGGMIGHDAHFFRITDDTDVAAAARWVDFFPADGQQTPAPAHYVGGIHDMPEGSTAYFVLELEEGEYGVVAEIPDAQEKGMFTTFTISAN